MKDLHSEKPVTVAELKAMIAEWPDTDDEGKTTIVWLEDSSGDVSPCFSVQSVASDNAHGDIMFTYVVLGVGKRIVSQAI